MKRKNILALCALLLLLSACGREEEQKQETGLYTTVVTYTGNIHCNYAHSILTQWLYIPFEGTGEEAYRSILPYIEECGAGESVKQVKPVKCLPEKTE